MLVTHASGDEGTAYERHLHEYADLLGVRVIFAADVFAPERSRLPDGRQVFSLADAYQMAELVTYPSTVEGFGNAFIETIYYRRPIVMSSYEIFRTDIQPKGFRVIEFEDFMTKETVDQARRVLEDNRLAAEMVDHNFEVGRRYYSFHDAGAPPDVADPGHAGRRLTPTPLGGRAIPGGSALWSMGN